MTPLGLTCAFSVPYYCVSTDLVDYQKDICVPTFTMWRLNCVTTEALFSSVINMWFLLSDHKRTVLTGTGFNALRSDSDRICSAHVLWPTVSLRAEPIFTLICAHTMICLWPQHHEIHQAPPISCRHTDTHTNIVIWHICKLRLGQKNIIMSQVTQMKYVLNCI